MTSYEKGRPQPEQHVRFEQGVKPEIVSEEERLRIATQAKANCLKRKITVETPEGEREVTVHYWYADFRSPEQKEREETGGEELSPLGIYIPGFGQTGAGDELTPLQARLVHHAADPEDGFGRMMVVSLDKITPWGVTEQGQHRPSYRDDGFILRQAITATLAEEQGFSEEEASQTKENPFPPLRIYGYSEGSGVAISTAAEFQEALDGIGSDQQPPGTNRLTLFSLTGVGQIAEDPTESAQAAKLFAKEVGRITLHHITAKFPTLWKRIKGQTEVEEAVGEGALDYLWEALKDAGSSIRNLGQVVGRTVTAEKRRDLRVQLSKLLRRNEDCDNLDQSWDIIIRAPRGDTIYDPAQLDRFYKEEHPQIPWKVSQWASLEETLTRMAFPYAHEVEVELIGERTPEGRNILEYNHHLPEKQPELVLPDS